MSENKTTSEKKAGIVAYGSYIPATRLPLGLIHGGKVSDASPVKAVAGFDEDAITMAVSAAVNCLQGRDRDSVDAIYFASTSAPFREKQAATLIAKALDLSATVNSMDFGGSLRAGASALIAAFDAVSAAPGKCILVIASDVRLAAPRSPLEAKLGDAAAAFLVGSDNIIAEYEFSHCISDEIQDVWQSQHDDYLRSWEDRFNIEEGYLKSMSQAIQGLLSENHISSSDYHKAALYAPDQRSLFSLAKATGFAKNSIQDALFGQLGNCGAAFGPILLISALEAADQQQRLLAGFYGDGAQAISFKTTACIKEYHPGKNIASQLENGRRLKHYDSYLKSRHLEASEFDRRGGDGIAATIRYRERDTDISFIGQRCRKCQTMHFPASRVCYGCYSKDDFEDVRLSDKQGRVLSYSFDYFFPSPEPPLIVGMCEVEGGARAYLQMADASPEVLRCDLPVEFVFRKIHDAGNKPNYFWKSRPSSSQVTKHENNHPLTPARSNP